MLLVEDVVIQNIDLSHELETAIEAKMVQEQEAAKAKFTQQKAQIEADTVVIKAGRCRIHQKSAAKRSS